jgi:hypothetical protein
MTKFKIVQKKVRKRKSKTVYDDFVELGLPSKPNPWNPWFSPKHPIKLQGLGLSCHFCGSRHISSFPGDMVARCYEHRNEPTPAPTGPQPAEHGISLRYTYSVRRDFLGNVDAARLHTEIQHSIGAPLVKIETFGDHVDIIFNRILSAHEKTTLDGDAHPARGLIETHRSKLRSKLLGEESRARFEEGLVGCTAAWPGVPYIGYTGVAPITPPKEEPERQSFIYASDPVMCAAGGTCTTTIAIQQDADFYCDEIRILSTGPCSLMIRGSAQDRNWFNKNIPSGLMRGGLKLTIPRRIADSSYLYLQVTDISLATNEVRVSLHGYKEFPVNLA